LKGRLALFVKVGVSLALLAYLLWTSDLPALVRRVRGGDTLLLALALLVYAVILGLSTWRWHLLLQAQGYPASLRRLSASYLVATFFNNFLPSNIGGDVVRVRETSSLTGSTTASLAVVAIDRILGLLALYVLALGAFFLGYATLKDLPGAGLALVALTLVFGVLAWVFFRPGIARRLLEVTGLGSREWARQRFAVLQGAVNAYRARVGAVWAAFGASVALQALVVCYYYAVALALRIPLPLAACFLVVPLCSLVQTVPVSFNGWGIREGVYILYFIQLGLPDARESALAFSLVGASLIVLLSLSGAVVWTARPPTASEAEAA
jgi:hypothetical protein